MSSIVELNWIDLASVRDERGILTSIESSIDIPFEIKRIFYMHHIVSDRGGHAHRDTDQVIIAISGSFQIELFDGTERVFYTMASPVKGLFVPRMIFIQLSDFSKDAVCMVLASTHYDIKKSLRNMEDYNEAINE